MRTATREEIEQLLRQLRGVVSVSVSGDVSSPRVHVLAAPERSDRQLSRDIRSALIAYLDLAVSPERIQVVPLPGESLGDIRPTRPELVSVEVLFTDDRHVARVKLGYRDRLVEGRCEADTERAGLNLVAEATVDAVHRALQQRSVFCIERVYVQQLGEREAVVAAVGLRTQRLNRHLLGASYVFGSPYQATAQAVLDAVNRQFERPTW